MKKILIYLAVAVILAACSATPANNPASKSNELQQYKQQMAQLKQKIDAIEKELASTETGTFVNVGVTELTPSVFERFIEVTGKVEADQDVDVSPESIGVIEEVLVKEGQMVGKGQALAVLNTEALKRNVDELKIQLDLATTTYTRQKNLWEQNIGSEMQLLQARSNMEALQKRIESAQAQINMSVVKAPVSGVVDIVYQKKGQIGSPQTPFARIINTSTIRIYADIAESYLPKIRQGDKAVVFFPALNREVETTIYRIGNVIDPNNRTFRIRLNLNNPGGTILPNLISIVRLRDYVSTNALVVPTILVKEDFRGNYTFIAEANQGKQVARKVYVKPGVNSNNQTEIVEGLTAGMKIITEGNAQVVDGTPLQF